MKSTLAIIMVCLLIVPIAFAAGQGAGNQAGDNSPNTDSIDAGEEEDNSSDGTQNQESNKGEETEIQNKVRAGNYTTEKGEKLEIKEQSNNRIQLKTGNISAETSMNMTKEEAKIMVKLSNGKKSEVKVMPDTASERAIERLKLKVCSEENNCVIELKEVGEKVAYEVKAQKQAKILGLFKTKMQVQAQVDAENGEVIQTKKPWWAFLASESE